METQGKRSCLRLRKRLTDRVAEYLRVMGLEDKKKIVQDRDK